jgi:beta-phosphoglucomutase-like phosphatase (HAD superfamily)
LATARIRPHVVHVLERTRAVLFVFDGAVCDLFSRVDTAAVARRIRDRLLAGEHRMSVLTATMTDPLWLLSYAHGVGPGYGLEADKIMQEAEIAAARTATPTLGVEEALRSCRSSGRRVAVVGDNCSAAMKTYLDLHNLQRLGGPAIGREHLDWHSTEELAGVTLISEAAKALDVEVSDCALVSLTPHSLFMAAKAGARGIGVISNHANRKHLASIGGSMVNGSVSGGSVVVPSLSHLATALMSVPMNIAKGIG